MQSENNYKNDFYEKNIFEKCYSTSDADFYELSWNQV